jgi:ABC-2 type transport system permease protein
VTKARFRTLLQYRGAAVGGLITQVFFGLINLMVFRALFSAGSEGQPMNLNEVITYLWLNQAFFAMQPWQPDGDVRQMMRTGSVAYELTRPCSLFWLWMARAVAMRSAPTLLRAAPIIIVAYLFFGLQPPASWASAICYAFSLTAALLLSSALTVVLNSTLFWTISADGATLLAPALLTSLSGLNIPLPFYPEWMQGFLRWQPFRGLLDVPSRIYSGSIPAEHAWLEIFGQLAWTSIFLLIGSWMVNRGLKRLVVQGG